MAKKNSRRILVVEDEKDMAALVRFRLEANGYEVSVAHDGQEALTKARHDRPDLIVLDLMLPKMSGYEVCAMLKQDSNYKSIPIVVFTARAQDADKKLAFSMGADEYLTKPFEPEILLEKIKKILGS